jgi:hypothetical protein
MKQICLGVQSRTLGIVTDSNLCIRQPAQFFDGPRIRRSHVARSDDTQPQTDLAFLLRELSQVVQQYPQPAPADE